MVASANGRAITWPQVAALIGALASMAVIHGAVVVPHILAQADSRAMVLIERRMQERVADVNRREDAILQRLSEVEQRIEARLVRIEEKVGR